MMRQPRDGIRTLIVIVNFRSTDVLDECLRALEADVETNGSIHVAICENGSGDDSAERLRMLIESEGWCNWCSLLPLEHNRGFTGGNNVILEAALRWREPPEFLLLLNPDTVPGPGLVPALVESLEAHPEWGFVGPVMTFADNAQHPACFRDIRPINEFLHAAGTGPIDRLFRRWIVSTPIPHREAPHEWITFACAMTRRSVLQQTGLLDEGYFAYFDDADLCWRARRAGWVIGHCPRVRCVHLKGTSSGVHKLRAERRRAPAYQMRGRARYFAKRHGIAGLWLANLCWHAGRLISWSRELIERRPSHLPRSQWRDIWTNAFRPWHAPHLPHPPLDEETADPPESETALAGIQR
jgi:N-acetylglucosaminyl-diphospho-decaprenol L-rhamnosyltransferase